MKSTATGREQFENRSQAALDRRQPLAGVPANQLVNRRGIGGHERRFLLELPPRAGKRQAFDQKQVPDPRNLFHVRPAIDTRSAGRLRDAQVGEFRLPRAQHVRLYFEDIAHLSRLEERAVWNLDLS